MAYDRRGHGRSDVPAHGYDADTLSDNLAGLMTALALREATPLRIQWAPGRSCATSPATAPTVARVVLLAPITPMLLNTEDHPVGLTPEMVEGALAEFAHDRPRWFAERRDDYFALGTGDDRVSRAFAEHTMRICLATPPHVQLPCQRTMFRTDFRADVAACPRATCLVASDPEGLDPSPPNRHAEHLNHA